MENKPTVLTLEHGGLKTIIELPWDADIDMITEKLKVLLMSVGFANDLVNEQFKNE